MSIFSHHDFSNFFLISMLLVFNDCTGVKMRSETLCCEMLKCKPIGVFLFVFMALLWSVSLSAAGRPVSPTYWIPHLAQVMTYTRFLVLQLSFPMILNVFLLIVLVMVDVSLICMLHNLHFVEVHLVSVLMSGFVCID